MKYQIIKNEIVENQLFSADFSSVAQELFDYKLLENKNGRVFLITDNALRLIEKGKHANAFRLMRRLVIDTFCDAVAEHYNCSNGYAQKCVVKAFGYTNLTSINERLIKHTFELFGIYCADELKIENNRLFIDS